MSTALKLGILVSGSGTNLQAILNAINKKKINVDARIVISNQSEIMALERARKAKVQTATILHHDFVSQEAFEQALINKLKEHEVEWVALAGFTRLLSMHFLNAFNDKVINIHPALLPAFPGLHAQRQALEYGVRFSGCTVHFVNQGIDTGPIIVQAVVPVLEEDTEELLTERILRQEHQIYPWALQLIASGSVHKEGNRVWIQGIDCPYGQKY